MMTQKLYRKVGRYGWHDLIRREEYGALILCCVSGTNSGGVSVTEPYLDKFRALSRDGQKLVLLRNTSAEWSALCPLDDLPETMPMPGRVGDDGRERPSFRIYDQLDLEHAGDRGVDPDLIELLDDLRRRRDPAA